MAMAIRTEHGTVERVFNGAVHPSDMIFDTMDIYARVIDLPMDMMNRVYGELIGGWIAKCISVDVDKDGMAWGHELRIRVAVRVDQPIPSGVLVRTLEDDEDGRWFELKYEKTPHFCFDCGCLVHSKEGCQAEKLDVKQWGEWLRAALEKNRRQSPPPRPTMSGGNFGASKTTGSHLGDSDPRFRGTGYVRDLPPQRSAYRDYDVASSSRTGVVEHRHDTSEDTSPAKGHRVPAKERLGGEVPDGGNHKKNKTRTYTQRSRRTSPTAARSIQMPLGMGSKKRGQKQVGLPVEVKVVGEGDSGSAGKRLRTSTSVFDRIEDPTNTSTAPMVQGRRDQ